MVKLSMQGYNDHDTGIRVDGLRQGQAITRPMGSAPDDEQIVIRLKNPQHTANATNDRVQIFADQLSFTGKGGFPKIGEQVQLTNVCLSDVDGVVPTRGSQTCAQPIEGEVIAVANHQRTKLGVWAKHHPITTGIVGAVTATAALGAAVRGVPARSLAAAGEGALAGLTGLAAVTGIGSLLSIPYFFLHGIAVGQRDRPYYEQRRD